MTTGPFDDPIVLKPSEYGGKEGLVQKRSDGHTPTPGERLNMPYRTDPLDEVAVDPVTGEAAPFEE